MIAQHPYSHAQRQQPLQQRQIKNRAAPTWGRHGTTALNMAPVTHAIRTRLVQTLDSDLLGMNSEFDPIARAGGGNRLHPGSHLPQRAVGARSVWSGSFWKLQAATSRPALPPGRPRRNW